MEFYSAFAGGRPQRLSEETRNFAWESLHGKYGDETDAHMSVSVDGVPGFDEMPRFAKYDAMVRQIAQDAPLRLCPAEKVCGAATLGLAIRNQIPALRGGKVVFGGTSHLTLDFESVIRRGMDAIETDIDRVLTAHPEFTDEQRAQEESMRQSVESMRVWHARYLEATEKDRTDLHALLLQVPFAPARTFHEALESLWFTFAFERLCACWPGIGCIDRMLGDYLQSDLDSGRLTLDEARELLASFFIKGCEWIEKDTAPGSGDAQHYQNLVIGGTDENGNDVTNEVTYLILDVVEELAIGDYPITVRFSEHSPEKLFRRAAEVMRHGGGIVAVYNEPLIMRAMEGFGYTNKEAGRFANDGCWEVQVPGETYFSYSPFDSLQILLNNTLQLHTDKPAHFDSYEELYAAFRKNLEETVNAIIGGIYGWFNDSGDVSNWHWRSMQPCSAVSLLEGGCIESGRSYLEGGPRHFVQSPHMGGAPDVGNSLLAIDRLVFREKKIGFDDFMAVLKANWEGAEPLRRYALNKITYYGNDDDTADAYTTRVLDDFGKMCLSHKGETPVAVPGGVSTFGRQIEWAPARQATPTGHRKGDVLSGNASPTPGTDFTGATAIIASYCKAHLEEQITGAALDVKLHPSAIAGENGVTALESLIHGFLKLGGFFMQLDVMDAEVLRRAQECPEDYKTLSVRISGWNARFVTLNREWQNMIINRTSEGI